MKFTLLSALVGLAAGLAGGGRVGRVARLRLRWWGLPVAWALLLAIITRRDPPHAFLLLVIAHALLVLFALANTLRLPGMWLVALGAAANLLVIGVNQGMPYRVGSAHAAGINAHDEARLFANTTLTHPEDADRLMSLAKIVPVAPVREVLSFGDLFMAFGMGLLMYHASTRTSGLRDRQTHRGVHSARAPAAPVPRVMAVTLDLRAAEPVIELGAEPTEAEQAAAAEREILADERVGELFWKTREEVLGRSLPTGPEGELFWALREEAGR